MLSFYGYIRSYNIQHHNSITISKKNTERQTSTTTKRTQIFILENPHGEEKPSKLPLYKMYKKYKTRPQIGAPPSIRYLSLSLSYALCTSECVLKRGTHLLYLYSFRHLTFNLTSRPHLTKQADFTQEDSIQYYIIFIRVLLT